MPGIIRCPNCGQEIDSNSRFCVHCTARICPGCHGPIPAKAIFCPHCGFSVGPAMPSAAEQPPPTPIPPPRQFPYSQGGIIGPQPVQPPSYPPPPPAQAPSAIPGTPIPQSMPPRQYGTGDQPLGTQTPPGAMPYVSAQQPSASTQKTFVDTGPIRVRRFPSVLIILLIIAAVGLAGFAAFKVGWLEAPLSSIQEFASGIKLPQWLPIGSKDTTPPAISEVNVSGITQTGAVITWQTDEPATSQVMICDPAGGCTWTEPDENMVTNHSVIISDLKSNITYHYTATSTDANKNQSLAEGDLTTLAQAPATALAISGVKVSSLTDSNATISWQTDQPATSQLEYGATDSYGSATPLDEKLTTGHSITLAGLQSGTVYHFKVKSKDSSGNEVASQDQAFTTRSTVAAATEVGPEVGQLAPDFTLPTLDGKEVSLSALRGKIVMINFWQDVQQSRNELTNIQAVYDKWPQNKLAVLAISWNQTLQVTQAVVNSKALTLPILLDETGEVAAKYKVTQSPVTIFIDTQGIVRDTKYYPATLKGMTQIESVLNSMQ